MSRPMLGQMRISPEAEKVLQRVLKAEDAKKGLKLLAGLVGKEVVQWFRGGRWVPFENGWDGRVWLKSFSCSDEVAIKPSTPICKAIKKAMRPKTMMRFGRVVVERVSARDEGGFGSTMADQGGTTPEHLRFMKLS